ncbi:MAG: hypothetical protein Q8K24_13575 [Hydrogenophaga sp.]|nr:hypothetical protein [Hydrogenophaga sp.]
MKLDPKEPPGRSTRKARRFAAEISALRAQGYTFEAIRQALAEVGVQVSNATVQREAARATRLRSQAMPLAPCSRPDPVLQGAAPPNGVPAGTPPQRLPDTRTASDLRSAREIAEAFTKTHISNPLVRARVNAKDVT